MNLYQFHLIYSVSVKGAVNTKMFRGMGRKSSVPVDEYFLYSLMLTKTYVLIWYKKYL